MFTALLGLIAFSSLPILVVFLAIVFGMPCLAPTPTVRQTPTGRKMPDGWQSEITFANIPNLCFYEKQVKPPGVDGGPAIDTTTMFNQQWFTFYPMSLKKLTEFTVKGGYDPALAYYLSYILVNVNTTITIRLPTNATFCFYGYLMKAEFDDLEIGKFPEGSLTIMPTNYDPANFVEAGPVYTAAGGTP